VFKFNWSGAPFNAKPAQKRNFINVQIDGIAIGLVNAASPFLAVFLTRLGATNLEVGLLSSMPGLTGLLLAIPIGRFLQTRRNIVPWFSASRLLFIFGYAATGLAAFFVPSNALIPVILAIWAIATLPQTALAVCFSVVMNAVAGPNLRYELMSRRWSILGLTNAIAVLLVGQVLNQVKFPINYQGVFIGLSLAGLVSFYFSSRISLPETEPPVLETGKNLKEQVKAITQLFLSHPDFLQFSIKRFVFLSGVSLATPLFALYYVREIKANDAWIGVINTTQTAVLLIGYFLWPIISRKLGSRYVLLATTLGLSVYPVIIGLTHQVYLIALFAALAGIFQAGIDLVFFDELMKTVPIELSATFISLAQSMLYASTLLSPMIGTLLANQIGLSGALFVSGGVRFLGYILFSVWRIHKTPQFTNQS
jgi:MFS family permease